MGITRPDGPDDDPCRSDDVIDEEGEYGEWDDDAEDTDADDLPEYDRDPT